MKIKGPLIIRTGPYQDWRPEIEVEVPDGLEGKALMEYLYKTYTDIGVSAIDKINEEVQLKINYDPFKPVNGSVQKLTHKKYYSNE